MPATTDGEERADGPAAPAAAASEEEPGPSSAVAAAAAATAAAAAAQITRPSNKRRRNLRQTRVTAGDGDDESDVDADEEEERRKNASAGPSIDHATLIEDTRAMQKQRGKRTGIDTATLLLGSSRDRAKASLAASGAASDAEALAAANQLSATEAALGNTFGAGAGAGGAAARAREGAEAAADAEAARYVESRLAAALGRAPRSKRIEGDDDEGEGGRGREAGGAGGGDGASLFEAPREARLSLLAVSSAAGDADASALEPRGAGLGGDDDERGAVGLVEVALSAEDRLLNIERSEAAKRKARAAAAAAAASGGGGGGGGGVAVSHAASSSGFGGDGDGFRRRDLPASFGGAKKRR